MADVRSDQTYRGWSAAEIAADQALAASIHALSQADGLLNPALDPIFARLPARPRRTEPCLQGVAPPANLNSTTPWAGTSRVSVS
jgi:hypothetical protein